MRPLAFPQIFLVPQICLWDDSYLKDLNVEGELGAEEPGDPTEENEDLEVPETLEEEDVQAHHALSSGTSGFIGFGFGAVPATNEPLSAEPGGAVAAPRGTPSLLADFGVICVSARRRNNLRTFNLEITRALCPIIIEIKKFPHRHLSGKVLQSAILKLLQQAKQQAMEQAVHLFLNSQFEHQTEVEAVATTGPFWNSTTVTREVLMTTREWTVISNPGSASPPPLERGVKFAREQFKWSTAVRLGCKESNDRMKALRERLKIIARSDDFKLPIIRSSIHCITGYSLYYWRLGQS